MRTKIIATIGPASDSRETISRLISEGVHIFRLNFSHGAAKDFIGKILPVETNIIIFDVIGERFTAKSFCEKLAEDDILCLPVSSSQVRMVTHLDVTIDMVKKLNNLIAGM